MEEKFISRRERITTRHLYIIKNVYNIYILWLPNFENVPCFEHHVNKRFSKSTTFKLVNLVYEDVCRLIDEIS